MGAQLANVMRMPRISQKPAVYVPLKVTDPGEAKSEVKLPPQTTFFGKASYPTNQLAGSIAKAEPIKQKDVFADRTAVRQKAQEFAQGLERSIKSDPAWAWDEKFALDYVAGGGDGSNLTKESYTRALKFAESLEPAVKGQPAWAWEAELAVRCLKNGGDGTKLTKEAYAEALKFAESLPKSSKTSPAWAWDAKYALDLLLK